jgi:hypothetical protein
LTVSIIWFTLKMQAMNVNIICKAL